MAKHVSPDRRVEREAMHAIADAVDQHGRRAVNDVASRDLLIARLQQPARSVARSGVGGPFQNRERRAHRDIHVDVRRAIERIEHDGVFGLVRGMRNRDRVLVFLGGENADALAITERVAEHVVGVHVEFLLDLSLDVRRAVFAKDVGQARAADPRRNHLRGQGDARQEPREFARRAGEPLLVL